MTIVNGMKNHGCITCVLNIVVLTKSQEKIWLFMFLLIVILFHKNIQNNFTLTLRFQKTEMTVAPVNYIW